ncbi:MAG TPA: pilus assembly protein TadG-related protein [Gemmataceae bacterium]|jgi:Flp pilus assembly protein TadG
MKPIRNKHGKRRASVTPLAALLLVVLVGMLAFSIDLGYVVAVRGELQNTADAAALAGAQQLQTLYVSYYSPGQTQQQAYYQTATTNTAGPNGETTPISAVQKFAAYNQAGGVYITVPTSDISFSYYDGVNAPIAASYPNVFPNTVTVVTRRDSTANTPLGLFFSRVFGWSSIDLTATASATIYSGDGGNSTTGLGLQNVSSSSSTGYVSPHILPVALDVNVWQKFFTTGQSPDGTIHTASNGNPQLQVYPTTTNTPGSFGLIDVGVPSNNAPAFRNWIDDGQTPNDISYLMNNNLVPVAPAAPEPWKVGPGLKSTLLTNFQDQMGKSNLIPLFAPSNMGSNGWGSSGYVAATGTGQNATYAVVGFVGVKISEATGSGNNMNISIQPSSIVDPTLTVPNAQPALNPAAYTTSYTGGMQSSSGGAVATTGSGKLSIYNQTSTNPTNVTATSTFGLPPTTFVSAKLTK